MTFKSYLKNWIAIGVDPGSSHTVSVISSQTSCQFLVLDSEEVKKPLSYWMFFLKKKK